MDDTKYRVALAQVPQLGTVRFRRLKDYFQDLENAWNANPDELREAGIESRVSRGIVAARSRLSPEAEIERLERAGVKPLHWHHPDYPSRLSEISDPPPILFCKGELLPSDERSVAVVGTRNPVSGLARGINSVAHRAALGSSGRTIALLGNGLDTVYPKEHATLSQQIQDRGAVASE